MSETEKTDPIPPMKGDCECCGAEDVDVWVVSLSMPMSSAMCEKCLNAHVEPYFALVVNTACCNGFENTKAEWQEYVKYCLGYLGKTMDEFLADVQKDLESIDNYNPEDYPDDPTTTTTPITFDIPEKA